MSYIKREFIRQVLEDEGKRLKKNQGIEMEKRLKFHTRNLFEDRQTSVTQTEDLKATLHFTFPIYQRFLDIKRRKVKKKKKSGEFKIKRGYRIHNRFVYGHYISVGNRIQYEFSAEVANAIKKDFEKQ